MYMNVNAKKEISLSYDESMYIIWLLWYFVDSAMLWRLQAWTLFKYLSTLFLPWLNHRQA